MPDTPLGSAFHTAERLRRQITERITDHLNGIGPGAKQPGAEPKPAMPVTVSIGVAVFAQHARSLDELVHSADTALYQAKVGGRSRTSTNSHMLN